MLVLLRCLHCSGVMGDAAFVVKDPVAAKRNDSILRNIITGGRSGSAANSSSSSSANTSTSHVSGGHIVPEFSLWKVSVYIPRLHIVYMLSSEVSLCKLLRECAASMSTGLYHELCRHTVSVLYITCTNGDACDSCSAHQTTRSAAFTTAAAEPGSAV
jgi:hypothetical protein